MDIVKHFGQRAAGPVLLEVSLPVDERLLGGDALPDWRAALEDTAIKLGIPVELREIERGYAVAFLSNDDCDQMMAVMQPRWITWLTQRLNGPAARAYFDNTDDPQGAVSRLVTDYGFTFHDFKDYIARIEARRAGLRPSSTEECIDARYREHLRQREPPDSSQQKDPGRERDQDRHYGFDQS